MIANRCSLHKSGDAVRGGEIPQTVGTRFADLETGHPSPLRGHPELDFLERLRAGEDAVAEGRTRDAAAISDELRARYKLG